MSSGGAGAVQFQINKNNASQGIYFHREKPKNDQRKFGYKSKSLRHPIRQPDYEEELERMQKAVEEDKRKFNKRNTDFIRKNRERYRPKENAGAPVPGTTHIAPGTVTLTQDQLAALLKTLGKSSHDGGSSDSPLRISIDAENNKIEVERYESESNGDRDDTGSNSRGRSYSGNDDDNASEVGIEALLNNGPSVSKSNTKKPTKAPESRQQSRSGTAPKPQHSTNGPEVSSVKPDVAPSRTSVTRISLEDAKKEAGVGHVPDTVPWRHLTVAERKRLQWARERAEVEEYNPWGRPGAGAPTQKQTEEIRTEKHEPDDWVTKGRNKREAAANNSKADAVKSSTERKKEELANEILQIQLEIREAEERRKQEEEKQKERRAEEKKARKRDPPTGKKAENRKTQQKEKQGKKDATPLEDNDKEENKVQIVIINRKRDRSKSGQRSEDERVRKGREDRSSERHKERDETPDAESEEQASKAKGKDTGKLPGKGKTGEATETDDNVGRTSRKVVPSALGSNQNNEEAHLSKKEIERRKWLAELDKQREEQRLKKQMEKERDRAELQDQWADRFVYHKTPRQISPRAPQSGPNSVPASRPSGQPMQAFAADTVDSAPPAAMRSSMVVGDGSLNENRYDNKKAEEKRKWLQELDQQREEQRLARQALKERDRQENNGTWADHYQTDRQKLMHAVPHHLGQGQTTQEVAGVVSNLHQSGQTRVASPPATSNVAGRTDTVGAAEATVTQRTSSAPYPLVAAAAPEEP
ncbi:myosin-10-like [Elysia marginata]|uniref:Myosin-10-like n=1 Tax=Elysia marginata TaxID=1093978 RepID=A0AAV4HC15_9GAST|nr:myosin-10-like [Elysia marginata]